MTSGFRISEMVRLYSLKDYILSWDFWVALLLTVFYVISLMFMGPSVPQIVRMTLDDLLVLSGVLLGILIGAMAIMVSVSSEDFIAFIKEPVEGRSPLYDKIIFNFIWPTIWLSVSIFSSLTGKMLVFSQDQTVRSLTMILAVISLGTGTYGVANAVNAVLSVSYLAKLRGKFIEVKLARGGCHESSSVPTPNSTSPSGEDHVEKAQCSADHVDVSPSVSQDR